MQNNAKNLKINETLANGYSSESAQQELSNEYQDDRVKIIFNFFCILVIWMNITYKAILKGF